MEADELAFCREQVIQDMDSVATIKVKTEVKDASGGKKTTYVANRTYICTLQEIQTTPTEESKTGQVKAVSRWRIFMPWGSTCDPKDRIEIGGHDYEVTDTNIDRTDQFTFQVDVYRIEAA